MFVCLSVRMSVGSPSVRLRPSVRVFQTPSVCSSAFVDPSASSVRQPASVLQFVSSLLSVCARPPSVSPRQSVFPSVRPSIRPFVHLFVRVHPLACVLRPSVRPSILFSARSSVHPFIRSFARVCTSIRLSVRPSIHPSVLSFFRSTVRPSVRSFTLSDLSPCVHFASFRPSVRLFVRLFVRPSVRLLLSPFSLPPSILRPSLHPSV